MESYASIKAFGFDVETKGEAVNILGNYLGIFLIGGTIWVISKSSDGIVKIIDCIKGKRIEIPEGNRELIQ